MPAKKRLVLAFAAAGLTAGVSWSQSESEAVFVPELALVDGAVCRTPIANRGVKLVQLAQARQDMPGKKTGISPAAPAAAQALSGAAAPDDTPLMSGLGTAEFAVTTSSDAAQRYFQQGYRLAWAFNHDEALRAFRKAQQLDPQCAMCYWGEAWALGPNINMPMEGKANAPALVAVRKARQLAPRTSPVEQALIAALADRYSSDSGSDRSGLDLAYAREMRKAAKAFPDNLEVATLYADALMNTSTWDYWQPGGKALRPALADLVPTLERVLTRDPAHAAAIHLYIHAVEASANPQRAERYADTLAQLAPRAGHLVHMPSHIYFVIGRYKDSLATNLAAVKADEAYIAARNPSGVYPLGYYPHNVHFAMVSAQMGGDGKIVIDSARKLETLIPAETAREVLLLQPIEAAPYFAHAQFSDADVVMGLPNPGSDLPYVYTAWRYARGVALAANDDIAGAERELVAMERHRNATDYGAFEVWKIPAREVADIAAHVLRARIAQARDDLVAAERELRAAIGIEDTLPYMEPAYWYYPVRQSLGAILLLRGDPAGARETFGEALARTPNNAWALYGLAEAYRREGSSREARAVEQRFAKSWMGPKHEIELEQL